MSAPWAELRAHLGERDRTAHAFAADRLLDLFAEHRLAVSALIRGVEGFGAKHQVRTDRLLSLSEDPPVVAVAVDEVARIEGVLEAVRALPFTGPVTVRPAVALDPERPELEPGAVKLSIFLGRGLRSAGRPAYEAAVAALRDAGADGATALVGVDGTRGGERRRGRFFAANAAVPALVVSVVEAERIAAALPALAALPGGPILTVAPVRPLKRDGARLAGLQADRGEAVELTLYSAELNHVDGRPVHVAAVERLRRDGAAGATALRGVWGYHGDHAPHGDSPLSLRRRVPTVTVAIAAAAEAGRVFDQLDHLTPERGLITAESVRRVDANEPADAP